MPRQSAFQVENNFTKGLITEATGLNFPENSCTETYDCILSEKGRATRRLGFDYEGDHSTKSVNRTDGAITEFLWHSAGASGDTDIVVVQIGSTLYYYKATTSGSLSGNAFSFTTNLITYKTSGATNAQVAAAPCQYASGNGFLFIVHPFCEPLYVAYSSSGPSKTETQITIQCRDLEGDKTDTDYLNFDTRPGTLSNPHKYNLYNQGWYVSADTAGGGTVQAVTYWDGARTDFPANSDIWWTFKDSNEELNSSYFDRFPATTTPAPKGHYILDEFNTNRTTLSGVTATERNSGTSRPSTVAFHASRIWYSGVNAQEYNQKIYYSQIIDQTTQFGLCYQQQDPTAEDNSDLLPTDGGVIIIPDVGVVKKLFPMQNSLIVFGSNGVWSISGSEGIGFKASDYAINKLSNSQTLSPLSFVDVYGVPIWWNTDGIFTVTANELGSDGVQSLTDDTIKTFFLDIPSESKETVKGYFNPRTRIIQWIYSSTIPSGTQTSYEYDRVLNYNILSKAFYPWTIGKSATSPIVHGIIAYRGPVSESVEAIVTDGSGATVTDVSGDSVIVDALTSLNAGFSFRYLETKYVSGTNWNLSFAQEIDDSYLDWATDSENIDYDSYFYTGYKIHGQAIRFFENNYLTITMLTEANASCFIQGVWDYANSPSGARFTNPQQVYIDRGLRDIQQTRKKIRGRGRSLHYLFYSETGKPFTIHGWSAWETQNAAV